MKNNKIQRQNEEKRTYDKEAGEKKEQVMLQNS